MDRLVIRRRVLGEKITRDMIYEHLLKHCVCNVFTYVSNYGRKPVAPGYMNLNPYVRLLLGTTFVTHEHIAESHYMREATIRELMQSYYKIMTFSYSRAFRIETNYLETFLFKTCDAWTKKHNMCDVVQNVRIHTSDMVLAYMPAGLWQDIASLGRLERKIRLQLYIFKDPPSRYPEDSIYLSNLDKGCHEFVSKLQPLLQFGHVVFVVLSVKPRNAVSTYGQPLPALTNVKDLGVVIRCENLTGEGLMKNILQMC